MKNLSWLSVSGVLGFFTVVLGAFGAHALKPFLDGYGRDIYHTAVQYQAWHTLAILGTSITLFVISKLKKSPSFSDTFSEVGINWLRRANIAWLIGILIFSGSLYTLALSGVRTFGALTPIGGVSFMLGWIFFAVAGLKL